MTISNICLYFQVCKAWMQNESSPWKMKSLIFLNIPNPPLYHKHAHKYMVIMHLKLKSKENSADNGMTKMHISYWLILADTTTSNRLHWTNFFHLNGTVLELSTMFMFSSLY